MKYYLIMEDFLYPEPPSDTQAHAEARLKNIENRYGHSGKMIVVAAHTPEEAVGKAYTWWKAKRKES